MSLLLMLFLLYQLNQPAYGVLILNSDDINSAIATNHIVYRILQLCTINNVKTISVIQKRYPITPFIPYTEQLSNAFVYYNYDAHDNIKTDLKSYSTNFEFTIFYGEMPHFYDQIIFEYIVTMSNFYKLILVTYASENDDYNNFCTYATVLFISSGLQKDDIIHICTNEKTQKVVAWTANLLAEWAPKPWLLDTTLRITSNTDVGLSVSSRNIDENINTCDSVFYRKNLTRDHNTISNEDFVTRALVIKLYPPLMAFNNHEIIEECKDCTFSNNDTKTIKIFKVTPDKWTLFGGFDGEVLATIFTRLRVTMDVIVYPEANVNNSSLIDWKNIENEIGIDRPIHLNSRDLTYISQNMTFVYPRVQREIRVITQTRGVVAVPARIRDIFNTKIIISAVIISSFFVLALRTVDRRDLGRAALDAFSLILGLAIPKLPNTLATRIFFASLILYFIILCTHFQGNVTQIMTVPLAAASVDSLDDLNTSGYTVYAGLSTYENFDSFRKRFHNFAEHDGEHCVELVLNDPNAACIDEGEYLYHKILKNKNLHLVKEPIRTFYATYLIDRNWLLKGRFEILFNKLSETGILHKWQKDIENLARMKAQIRESSAEYNSLMTLENFKIFFIILYTGLLISAIVWIGEMLLSLRQDLIEILRNISVIKIC